MFFRGIVTLLTGKCKGNDRCNGEQTKKGKDNNKDYYHEIPPNGISEIVVYACAVYVSLNSIYILDIN
jgi:hypothetical protein